jgi:hypothetical protein
MIDFEKITQRQVKGKLLVSIDEDSYKDYPAGTELLLHEVRYVLPPSISCSVLSHVEYVHPDNPTVLYWMPDEVDIIEDLGPYVKEITKEG